MVAENLSVKIPGGVVAAVPDVLHDRLAAAARGGKGGVHSLPGGAVKVDDPIDPTVLGSPDADPGVIGEGGIAYLQTGGNMLCAQHTGHQGRIVQADAFAVFQSGVDIGDIAGQSAAGNLAGLVIVIINISMI